MKLFGLIGALTLICVVFFPLSGDEKTFVMAGRAQVVAEDTYGKTRWDNPVNRNGLLYVIPVPPESFVDRVSFFSLPELKHITVDVPLQDFFSHHPELLVEGALTSTLKNGKERKNYWIEDCFFYDIQNGEAGLKVLNYFLLSKGNIKRTYFVHWDLKRNRISGAVLLLEDRHIPRSGEYDFQSVAVDGIGYNPRLKEYYYLTVTADMRAIKDGKYTKYIHRGDAQFQFYGISGTSQRKIAVLETGSRNSYGAYNAELNLFFLPAYRDLGHVEEKQHPEGFILDLTKGGASKITIQRHAYWSAFDPHRKVLYHVSSSSGTLWVTDLATGEKKAELFLGDAGDDRYRKLSLFDGHTLFYYLHGKVMIVDTDTNTVRGTIDLAARFSEFSASSPAYILPDGLGLVIEARTAHNKTTGFLYFLRYK
ncbi:MAG TPA: hypothetical protein ENN69_00445 [Spirochaetia bacterium]|nr:hypothetical protein [Spirochaetia bacterium]